MTALIDVPSTFAQGTPAFAQGLPADRLRAMEATYPPWQHGDASDVSERGFEFPVPPADALATDLPAVVDATLM